MSKVRSRISSLSLGVLCGWLALAHPSDAQDERQGTDGEIVLEQRKVGEERARKEAIARELGSLTGREKQLKEQLARDVRSLYRLQRGGLLPIAGGLEALVNHASRVAHLERMTERTLHKLGAAEKQRAKLGKEVAELELGMTARERKIADLESRRASLAAEQAAAAALAAQEAKMAVQAERTEAESIDRVSYGLTLVRGKDPNGFAAQRGMLALPVAGAANMQASEPMSDGRLKGLTFDARPGVSVRAAASGHVAAVEQAADGVVVVIDHGERYQTVYRGLASSDVEAGDAVSKSARLGSVGSTPLRFEVRRGSRNQDARSFLGL